MDVLYTHAAWIVSVGKTGIIYFPRTYEQQLTLHNPFPNLMTLLNVQSFQMLFKYSTW